MAKLRGALVGCGSIAEFHLAGWRRIPEVEIVAFADRSLAAARARRDRFYPDAQVFESLRDLLATQRVDFVDVLTPAACHVEHCLQARDHGAHVICQKPLAEDLTAATTLVDTMRASGRLFAIHENHRYRPWFRTLLQHARAGLFGQIRLVSLEQLDLREPPERHKIDGAQGVWLEYGTHLVDMLRALLGEPRAVFARAHRVNARVAGESLVHATFDCGEATGVVQVGWKAQGLATGRVLVVGDRGEACFEGTMTRGGQARFRLLRGDEVILDETRVPEEDYAESFYLLQRECTDAMLGRGTVVQTGEENLRTLAATFAPYESITLGRLIALQGARA